MSSLKYRQLLKPERVQKLLVYQPVSPAEVNNQINRRSSEPPFEMTSINVCDVNMINRVNPPKLCCCPEEEPSIHTRDVNWAIYCVTVKLFSVFVFFKLSYDSGFWCASEKSEKLIENLKVAFDSSGKRRREFNERMKEEQKFKELPAQQDKGKTKGKSEPQVTKIVIKPDTKAAQKPDPKVVQKPDPKAVQKPDPKAPQKPDPKAPQKPDPKAAQKPDPKVPQKPDPKEVQKPTGDAKKSVSIEEDFDYEGEPKNMKNIWNSMLINFVKNLPF